MITTLLALCGFVAQGVTPGCFQDADHCLDDGCCWDPKSHAGCADNLYPTWLYEPCGYLDIGITYECCTSPGSEDQAKPAFEPQAVDLPPGCFQDADHCLDDGCCWEFESHLGCADNWWITWVYGKCGDLDNGITYYCCDSPGSEDQAKPAFEPQAVDLPPGCDADHCLDDGCCWDGGKTHLGCADNWWITWVYGKCGYLDNGITYYCCDSPGSEDQGKPAFEPQAVDLTPGCYRDADHCLDDGSDCCAHRVEDAVCVEDTVPHPLGFRCGWYDDRWAYECCPHEAASEPQAVSEDDCFQDPEHCLDNGHDCCAHLSGDAVCADDTYVHKLNQPCGLMDMGRTYECCPYNNK